MSSVMRYWIGFSATVLLAALFGHMITYIMEPSAIRLFTSIVGGVIIGIVGYRLTEIWTDAPEDTL